MVPIHYTLTSCRIINAVPWRSPKTSYTGSALDINSWNLFEKDISPSLKVQWVYTHLFHISLGPMIFYSICYLEFNVRKCFHIKLILIGALSDPIWTLAWASCSHFVGRQDGLHSLFMSFKQQPQVLRIFNFQLYTIDGNISDVLQVVVEIVIYLFVTYLLIRYVIHFEPGLVLKTLTTFFLGFLQTLFISWLIKSYFRCANMSTQPFWTQYCHINTISQ